MRARAARSDRQTEERGEEEAAMESFCQRQTALVQRWLFMNLVGGSKLQCARVFSAFTLMLDQSKECGFFTYCRKTLNYPALSS